MYRLIPVFLLLLVSFSCSDTKQPSVVKPAITHEIWGQLLQIHVDTNGMVDYANFLLDKEKLNTYLNKLSEAHPNDTWTENERKAYWINAYNAYTVKLILDHFPVEGIKEIKNGIPFINSVWDIVFIDIQGVQYSLNDIEHKILRKEFDDPRIHFAINCASFSCPRLHYEAYEAADLNQQLEQAAIDFINDPNKNIVEEGGAKISKIFKWFGGDFKNGSTPSIRDYINEYAYEKVGEDADIDYLDYNWSLNMLHTEQY